MRILDDAEAKSASRYELARADGENMFSLIGPDQHVLLCDLARTAKDLSARLDAMLTSASRGDLTPECEWQAMMQTQAQVLIFSTVVMIAWPPSQGSWKHDLCAAIGQCSQTYSGEDDERLD